MLHVISADLPGDCLALESLLSCELAKSGQPAPVLDLTGEGFLASVGKPCESFLLPQALSKAWGRVHPEVSDWLKLLQLVEVSPEVAPTPPGIESLLQCFALAEWFPLDSAGDSVVLLPPLHGALQLLDLARSGPALLEQWSQPLLEWWRNTRRQLASLDFVLRLELPNGEDLVLAELWQRRLERLAVCLEDGDAHRCWLALDGGPAGSSLLDDRLCRFYLAGFQPTCLWVVGPEAGAQALQLKEAFWPTGGGPWVSQGDMLRSGGSVDDDSAEREGSQTNWIQRRWSPEKALQWEGPDAEGVLKARLLLPGLRTEMLQVKQLGSILLIQLASQTRKLKLPESGNLTCARARQEGRHLVLEFIHHD
jgi:hypothetical protein